MRLLKLNDDGSFSLINFPRHETPAYAILSHTWGNEKEEVTFNDMMNSTGKNKKGFQKLQFCGNQAKADNLQYFWVDTCCIDKSNNTELTTAINSMFRYYQNATKCYVYMLDVSKKAQLGQSRDTDWHSDFSKSRWFTRGWTLQELLAPRTVEFYSQDQVLLGDKRALIHQLREITQIALEALQGCDLSYFTVEERFKWGAKRQTTEEEDRTYCLLGIFNVTMPLVYGEGNSKARKRLLREIEESHPNMMPPSGKILASIC
jgi:hypothetical protein